MGRILLIFRLGCCMGCVLGVAALVSGAEPPPDATSQKQDRTKDKEEKAARMEHMKRAAKSYEITLASEAAKKLVLIEEPLLRFDDQVTGVLDGTLFLWLLDGRPAATASVWIRKTGHEFHEFQSLTAGALTASNKGQAKWTPAQPGIERKTAAHAQPPAATAVGRLNQMRALARDYSATVIGWENDQQVLRLLPQPVYRYGRPDGTVTDGAIFAYCKGTNPEVLLLVEAVKNGKGLEWNYAFARMTARGCEVRRDDKVVWNVPRLHGESPTDPYFNVVQRYKGPGAQENPTPGKDK
jgi:hypothetical protein